ncbi:G-patch domain and KOW motifs-containing protein-like [Lytechinus pictus]|uniref:G-patch domain and KOW motifs-containing protein-like n=1 Tax=Lytechinus pictus TaxID=7653 RepID=UPI0030BA24D6
MESDEGEKKKGFSFSFAKKKQETKTLESKNIGEAEILENKTETDYILSVDSKKVTSVIPKEKPEELVIPLIKRNEWQTEKSREQDETRKRPAETHGKDAEHSHSSKKKKDERKPSSPVNSLENEAVKEIMEDVSRYSEKWDERGKEDLNLTIPLLMQNKVPEGFETDDKLDVSIRPDAASEANYEEIPIEQFGMAMLRGMGWKEDEGIGSKIKKVVEPIEVTVRPKGQGLGADRRPGDALNEKKKRRRKPGEPAVKEEEGEPKGFSKGAHVLVCSGPHKNLYGMIEGVDEDNSRVVIKFALSNQSATLSQFAVQLVSKEEYKKYSKDLGKFSRGHDELKKREDQSSQDDSESDRRKHKHKIDKERTSSSRHDKHSRDRRKEDGDGSDKYSKRDRYENRERYENGEHQRDKHTSRDDKDYDRSRTKDDGHRKRDDDRKDSSQRKEERTDRSVKHHSDYDRHSSSTSEKMNYMYWLRPDLRVRFIDATYKKGKYYNVKVKIVDVITRDTCTCQTDDARFIEDIHQSMLETLIPKTDPGYIMVVSGKYKGQIGTVLKRDKANCQASVQLLRERDRIIKMDYDIICEFAGNIHDEEDY